VYYDTVSGRVLVWSAQHSAWLEANKGTTPTGTRPPIGERYIFFHTAPSTATVLATPPSNPPLVQGTELNVFLNGAWVACTPANTRIKAGLGWVPFHAAYQNQLYPGPGTPGDVAFIQAPSMQSGPGFSEVKVFTSGNWFNLTGDLVQVTPDGGVTWLNVVLGEPYFGQALPAVPTIGDFFYASAERDLLVWTGTGWQKADTANEGTTLQDKVPIGNDGSYDERLRLIKVLKGQLGWPQVCVELSEEQFNIAIDNALETFRQRADNAYAHRYVLFTLQEGQQQYYLNDPRLGTDKIVNVLAIHRVNLLGVSALSTESNIYAQAFFHQFYMGSMVDVLSIHLAHHLSEVFERIFAGNLTFTWDEPSRQLYVHRRPRFGQERVVLEVTMERTEQELLLDRWCKQWLQGWAHAELKEMLGMIRSKYTSGLPGPTGGLSLNGELLLAEARQDFEELNRQLLDYEVGNGGATYLNTAFMIG